MENCIEVNTKLELFDYLSMVNEIALEFFSADGIYQPHIGTINAMRLFYNKCVTKSKFDEKYGHDIVDAADMIEIVADSNFIQKYNAAIIGGIYIDLDFGGAYDNAMKIVDFRKSSFGNAVEIVGSIIKRLAESISAVLTDENIEKISQVAKEISNGNISAETIVDAYISHINKSGSISE